MHVAARPRDGDVGVADQHEGNVVGRIARTPALVVREELARSLAHSDPADVEKIWAGYSVLGAKAHRVPLGGDVDPDTDHLVGDPLVAKAAPHHAPLPLGV